MRIRSILKTFLAACAVLALLSCGGSLLQSAPVETAAAVITVTGINASVTESTATITWTTDVATTSCVSFGTVSGTYSGSTGESLSAETSHSVSLAGLTAGTMYYYVVTNSAESTSDVTSSEASFTTTSLTHPTLAERLRGIWVVGGLTGNTVDTAVSSVDLYDPVTDTWYAGVTALPAAVSFAGVTSWGGNIYVIGGFDASGIALKTVQIYDVAADSWSSGTAMPDARANKDVAVANNRIYMLGGSALNATGTYSTTTTTYAYNLANDSWSSALTAFSGTALTNRLCLAFDGIVYNTGGRTSNSATTLAYTMDGYIATVNSLTANTEATFSTTTGRCGMAGAVYSASSGTAVMVLVGGVSSLTGATCNFVFNTVTAGTVLDTVQYLTYSSTAPFTSSWTSQTTTRLYPLPVGFPAAALYGSKMYVFGGTGKAVSPAGLALVYSYDLANLSSGSWTAAAVMPTGRYGHDAVTITE